MWTMTEPAKPVALEYAPAQTRRTWPLWALLAVYATGVVGTCLFMDNVLDPWLHPRESDVLFRFDVKGTVGLCNLGSLLFLAPALLLILWRRKVPRPSAIWIAGAAGVLTAAGAGLIMIYLWIPERWHIGGADLLILMSASVAIPIAIPILAAFASYTSRLLAPMQDHPTQ